MGYVHLLCLMVKLHNCLLAGLMALVGVMLLGNERNFRVQFHYYYSSLKSKVGLIAAKAAALRINMNTDSCLVASRTASRRLASSHATSLLHSSLSHHLPRPQPFLHLT